MSEGTKTMKKSRDFTKISLLALAVALSATSARADALLSGAITSANGAPMAGVAVSAKSDARPITTTVYTDLAGRYVFPPLENAKYHVWAQAIAYEAGRGDVDLNANARQDFKLAPTQDFVRQLPGDEFLAALPEGSADDARMKTMVRKTCTGCHTPAFPLQHQFDEAGWTAVLDLMKHINVLGTWQGEAHKANASIETHEKELARYLARARGPGATSMNFNLRPRPTGEAARVVFKEYDVPLDPDLKLPGTYFPGNGADWSQGTPSGMFGGYGVHDAVSDLDGNIWFTHSLPSRTITVGRIDAKTGAFKAIKLDEPNGFASQTHGITRDPKGFLWFNTRPGAPGGKPTGLAKLDPKTEKIVVYNPPKPMSGTAGTLDVDPHGMVWVTSPDGSLRFDPATEKFTEFKSVTYKTPQGVGTVYGVAADRQGNGWWVDMKFDRIEKGDVKTGQTTELQLPPVQAEKDRLTPEDQKIYASYVVPDFNTPYPWAQGPRRLGADKNGDTLWVGNSFGGNLARIDINTMKMDLVPLPNPATQQPYEVAVDDRHNVWTNLWSTDAIAKYNPANSQWTLFDLPSRGTETRYISLLERNGHLEVVIPYSRTRRVALMTMRSEAELQ
ncbi:MAG: virginiamycin hydrolase Vgb, partial [Hyphomicrobiales bacterium]|nr:virginiamycin hydrolase Vgb [Hyphomicrobiales bacterium]